MRSDLHEAARRYTAAGWRVFPSVPRSKRPLVEWAEFQKRAPTTAEVDAWWTKTPDANLQVVTGNGIVCLDFDRVATLEDARSMLAREGVVLDGDVPAVQSGGSGWHLWLGIDRVVRPVTNLLGLGKDDLLAGKPQIDVRGDGSVATLPPSVHESGRAYRWAVPWRTPLPMVPPEFYALLERQHRLRQQARDTRARDHGWVTESLRGVGKGERAEVCARLAGYFLGKGMPVDIVAATLEAFGDRCDPPLPPREVFQIAQSVARTKSREELAEVSGHEVASDISAVLDNWLEEQRTQQSEPIPTPIPTLTRWLNGGLRPGKLVYLGARPGLGKSALALQFVTTAAHRGKRSLVVTLEMENTEVAMRAIAQEGRIDGSYLLDRTAASDPTVLRVVDDLRRMTGRVKLYDRPLGIAGMKRLIETHQPDLFVLDYLQLADAPEGVRDRRQQIEAISKELKVGIAKKYRIPVLALSSLARPSDGKVKRPGLHSLRESGQLEHDADIIAFLHSEDEPDATGERADNRAVTLILDKNRQGRLGDIYCTFHGPYYTLREISQVNAQPDPRLPREDEDDVAIPAGF